MKTLDYDALYALHEPDEVVMTVGEHEVTWSEYFYYLYRQATSVEGYFSMMSTYGLPANWTDPADDSGATYIDLTLDSAETTAKSLAAMEGFAEELGLELDEEDLKTIAENKPEEESEPVSKSGKGVWGVIRKILIFPFVILIKFYQVCISPLKPATCRFTPTCSQYAIEAFRKHGVFKGFYLAARRILRCHPWGGHGYDPVP